MVVFQMVDCVICAESTQAYWEATTPTQLFEIHVRFFGAKRISLIIYFVVMLGIPHCPFPKKLMSLSYHSKATITRLQYLLATPPQNTRVQIVCFSNISIFEELFEVLYWRRSTHNSFHVVQHLTFWWPWKSNRFLILLLINISISVSVKGM